MNAELPMAEQRRTASRLGDVDPASDNEINAAIDASRRVAPLWPLGSFVAVNPMLGFTDVPFDTARHRLREGLKADLYMPRSFYANAIADGRITKADIASAISILRAEDALRVDDVIAATAQAAPVISAFPTFAAIAGDARGFDYEAMIVDRISSWASGHFDNGLAKWRSPWKDAAPYEAWRQFALIDRTPDMIGVKGLRTQLAATPDNAIDALRWACDELGAANVILRRYFMRLLGDIAGWVGHARYRTWGDELRGMVPIEVVELLCIRIAYEASLARVISDRALIQSWRTAAARAVTEKPDHRDGLIDAVLLHAYEAGVQEDLTQRIKIAADRSKGSTAPNVRPDAQAVFCIDVRSERIRRAIEGVNPAIETLGFAGFFGVAIEVAAHEDAGGAAQCPVLLEPSHLVRESHECQNGRSVGAAIKARRIKRGLKQTWDRFKSAAVSSFAFVETAGLGFAPALLRDGFLGRAAKEAEKPHVSLEPATYFGRQSGIDLDARIALAEGAIAGMSLAGDLARLIVLVGHGSTTTNNPYAAGLDCGACGGHSGEANALVAAQILNDPEVRNALAAKGKNIPEDTFVLAGLHDTTTDEVRLLNIDASPASHREEIARLEGDLKKAARVCRGERAPALGIDLVEDVDKAVLKRAGDWSQVRPEWGLAGCAAFIAAPRPLTKNLNLEGRAFLHSYNYDLDTEESVLELILTAPVVVASWISLQYYGSTVDNARFGSGDKTLHNVVGGIGVYEGNGGDLRVGLPLQSVHDGERFIHEPVRLNVMIDAPTEAINRVLEKHDNVRALFDNTWLHLYAIRDGGETFLKYEGDFSWRTLDMSSIEPSHTKVVEAC